MQNLFFIIYQKFWVKKVFRKYKGCLPTKTEFKNPKMNYHILAGAVVWEDEGIEKCNSDLENAFRYVLLHRTNLICNEKSKIDKLNKSNKKTFDLAKKYFPLWIGFDDSRCSYNSKLSDRLKRIRKVSEWKIDKLINSESTY